MCSPNVAGRIQVMRKVPAIIRSGIAAITEAITRPACRIIAHL